MMEKIVQIRNNKNTEDIPNRVFIKLISNVQTSMKNPNLHKLKYADVRNSTNQINTENGAAYIHKMDIQSFFQFNIRVQLRDLHIFISEEKVISKFKNLAMQQL